MKTNMKKAVAIALAAVLATAVVSCKANNEVEEPTTAPTTTAEVTEPATTAETEPVVTEPAETEPVGTELVETEPVETEPVATEPVETEPVATEPEVTKSEETKPVETKPVETKPAETKPVETKPAETKPVETKPVETKPVVTEPIHEHTWVPVTVHHDETGHYEKTYETRTVIKCKCGQIFYDSASCEAHSFPFKEDGCTKSGSIEEMQVETGSKWVVDQAAWDEVVGYTCSECGATK